MHDGGAQSLPDIPLRYVAGVVRQAGALAWLPETSPTRFVIVTSRRTGRWILPKGSIDDGRSEVEIAAEEAWEEAGLSGDILPPMIGLYHTPEDQTTPDLDGGSRPLPLAGFTTSTRCGPSRPIDAGALSR